MLISCGDTSLLHEWYAIGRTGGPAGQFRDRNPRQSSIVKRCIRSSSYEFRFFSAASFCALPSPIMTATPCLSPSILLFLSRFFSTSIKRSFSTSVHFLRAFPPATSRRSWLCATIVRCSIAPRWPATTKRYAFTRLHRPKERDTETEKVSIRVHFVLLLFFTRTFSQPLMERGYRENGGWWNTSKWEIFSSKKLICWVFGFLGFLIFFFFFLFLAVWFHGLLISWLPDFF